jgi:hypothetical protein
MRARSNVFERGLWSDAPAANAADRFIGKKRGPFRHRMHLAGEAEIGEIIDQPWAEFSCACEPLQLFSRESQVLQKIERLLKSRSDQEAMLRRQLSHEEFENCDAGLAGLQIGLDHGQFIQIRQQRAH